MLSGAPALAAAPSPAAIPAATGQTIADFYAARNGAPLWTRSGNEIAGAALLRQILTAKVDGLDPRRYRVRELQRALRATNAPDAQRRAEQTITAAFVAFASDLRRAPAIGIVYVEDDLRPVPPSPRFLLEAAAGAPSLPAFIDRMGWMHRFYAPLRTAALASGWTRDEQRRVTVNLERVRSLPSGTSRYVMVNAADQRLDMVEGGIVRDSMRVVVGKPTQPTPMMAARIRFASLNPYWNVPPDLVAERIAPSVVKDGVGYLRAKGYRVLSDWSDRPRVISPATVDWRAVAAGKVELRVRQLPGPQNSMGAMKFMFPNAQGIYLHDTPNGELLKEAARFFSGGCVRLEDAPRLGRWLFGRALRPKGARPEQAVPLTPAVPVYLTYLTAVPDETGQILWFDDIYARDSARLAQLDQARRR